MGKGLGYTEGYCANLSPQSEGHMNSTKDTIAAISTPPGQGGISVVRMSGADAVVVADRIFSSGAGEKPSSFAGNSVKYGYVKVPGTEETVDEALLTVMRAPRTYTAEDVVEISCHGGRMPSKRVLEMCLDNGARLAEPGEFTKRAFLNGRMNLSQAEAVLDIISSETDAARKMAVDQLKGVFSDAVGGIRDALLDALAMVELSIDFSQEDVEFPKVDRIQRLVADAREGIGSLLATADKGIITREGASIVICGKPNAGKSSLMNALLRHDRVIVTPVAGTTRDVIEESIVLDGVKVRISDTAGIIETTDRVEIEGIKRSREKLNSADVVMFMLDMSRPLSEKDKDIYEAVREKKVVIAANKSDLDRKMDMDEASLAFGGAVITEISALKKQGLAELEDVLAAALLGDKTGLPEGAVVTSLRHKKLLEEAAMCLDRAVKTAGHNGELLASDVNEAVTRLGSILGESAGDDVLDRIFSRFCIGK